MPVMTYNSMFFVVFFAVFLIVYLPMPKPSLRQAVIIAGNVFFYGFACGLQAMLLLAAASLLIYLVTRKMERIYERI